MKRQAETQNPITKVTQTFQRADGSEARITATQDAIFGGKTHILVERRDGPDELWCACSTLPHPDWREMSVDEYQQRGRPEHLQTVTFAEMVKTTALLGRDLHQTVEEGLADYAPGQAPAVRPDAPLAEHVDHYLQAVRDEIAPEVFPQGQHHVLAVTLQEFFGGELFAFMSRANAGETPKWVGTTCKIDGQHYDVFGQTSFGAGPFKVIGHESTELDLVAIDRADLGGFIKQFGANPTDQDLAARLRAIGRREITVTVEQGTPAEDPTPERDAPLAEHDRATGYAAEQGPEV